MSRVWDVNWFGSTKTLDVHIGWLRRKLGDDPAAPRYIETVRGVGFRFAAPEEPERREPARARLAARASAYVLLLALVALGVPLGAQPARPRRRRGPRRRRAARPTSSRRPPRSCCARRQRRAGALATAACVGARPGHRRRPRAGACSPTAPGASAGRLLRGRPEIAAALRGRSVQETRHSDTLGADILATAVPDRCAAAAPAGAVRITQSVVGGAPGRPPRGRRRSPLIGAARPRSRPRRRGADRRARSPGRSVGSTPRRAASRRATSTRAPRSRAARAAAARAGVQRR